MIDEKDITRFLHTKACMFTLLAVACVMAVVAYLHGNFSPIGIPLSIGLTPARDWTGSALASLTASLASTISMGALILYINSSFNVMRSLTALMAGMFFIMQMALPSVGCTFYGGDVMGVMMLLGVSLMFSSFGEQDCQRRIFLVFFLISLAGFTDLSYLFYLPVFLVGCIQMRIFSLRTFLAAGLGVITPPWLLLGLGLVKVDTLHWPVLVTIWDMFQTPDVFRAMIVSCFTLFCGIGFLGANLLKLLSYNSRTRAFNGFLTLLMIATGLFAILNFNNFAFYIPLLNCLTAYQIAHFFTYRRTRRSYIPILLLLTVYGAFYFWELSAA